MVHFSECSTVAANCNTQIQIEMRDGTAEHFPDVPGQVVRVRSFVRAEFALDQLHFWPSTFNSLQLAHVVCCFNVVYLIS